ncbi:lantibiotic dehydratase family protein [Flavobacterium sp.]|uniref:lantibiotic dehydratase family protein n=1 Tax=Flavobacterium sp. TaxID=239 RepID=UPI002617AF7A|nr:lantibiotic dehydratase family protein [Flavobacterium sp.]
MPNYPIIPFSKYVLRSPAFPFSTYLNLLNEYSTETLLNHFKSPYVKEAIRIASPKLLEALDKWEENPKALSPEKRIGLEITLLKYTARMTSRCTPFGLFAGCDVGDFSEETNIVVQSSENFSRFTQFDMHFWVSMLQEITKRKEVIAQLNYYPNNSIYSMGDFYRFVEYKYVNTKREHSISALRKSELLETLLLQANKGITVKELASYLADDDSETEEALEFIYQLIDFQFLVSELDARVTGSDEWERLFAILNKIPALKEETEFLKSIQETFTQLDKSIVPSEKSYQEIQTIIQKMGFGYEKKYLFQTDLNIITSSNQLNSKVSRKVMNTLHFLNGIKKTSQSETQKSFMQAFLKRYESREMPLTTVLDTEIGIGYLQNSTMNDTHPILDQFSFKNKTHKRNQSLTAYEQTLNKKYTECILKSEKTISLSEKDFPDFDSNWDKTAATFSVMIEVLNDETIVFDSSGNTSAAKLLGRFCNGNQAIYDLTNEIIEKETQYHSDKILAEIVHIPESRTGNILRRPALRPYEIAYLSNSGVPNDSVIELADLMISVKTDSIVLRSKKHNKEVIPCLSNAHNYSSNSLPIYHFLSDLQSQNFNPIYNFSWGILETQHDFLPRVLYKDVVLSKAKWIVHRIEIESFFKMNDDQLLCDFSIWRNKRQIVQYANWVNFDNTLLLDFEKLICIKMFLKSISNYSKITLEEFLFTEESVVKNEVGENFTNQFILSFYKQ